MSAFFNGQLLITPAVATAINDNALLNSNPSTPFVLALVGPCTKGQPNTALSFSGPTQAAAALGTGDLVDAIVRAFNPSQDVQGPATIIAIRVNPALQSSLSLVDVSAAPVVNLTSTDYGALTNGLMASVASGSVQGKMLSVGIAGGAQYVQDNVYQSAFTIQYSGGQTTATMSVSNSTVTLSAPAGTPVATIALSAFPTVAQLVANINTVAGFAASVISGSANSPALNGLDTVTNQDVKTAPYTATATLQAIVNWFNGGGQPLVTATRPASVGTLPANLGNTFLTGGTDGSTTNTQWSNAFTVLQGVDCQWVTPVSGSASIIAMAEAHVIYMSTTGRKERRAVCGMALSTSDATAIAESAIIGSDRVGLVHIGGYDFNAAGVLTLYAPYIVAAMVAGGFAGSSPGTPMTNKRLNLQGLERVILSPTGTDPLIQGGVIPVTQTATGIRVVQSISTWLTDTKFDKVELSCGAALDYVARQVRSALSPLKGQEATPGLVGLALSIVDTTLRLLAVPAPNGPGVIVGDANSPAYSGIQVNLNGDITACQFQCSPVIPNNYVLATIYAVPYQGSASAS